MMKKRIILYANDVREFGRIFSRSVFKNIRHKKIESRGEHVIYFKEIVL